MNDSNQNLAFDIPSSVEGIIFDCDGTLADTMPTHFVAWQKVMASHGIEFDEAAFYSKAGQPTIKIVQSLLDRDGVKGDADVIAKQKYDAFLQELTSVRPIQPVVDVAHHYHGQLPMGVGSGSSRSLVFRLLDGLGIREMFGEAIVGAEDTQRHKPEPDVFLEVARRINVAPEKCVVFEDADLGIESARRAGMHVIDIRPVYSSQS